jgi:hypothetical protein
MDRVSTEPPSAPSTFSSLSSVETAQVCPGTRTNAESILGALQSASRAPPAVTRRLVRPLAFTREHGDGYESTGINASDAGLSTPPLPLASTPWRNAESAIIPQPTPMDRHDHGPVPARRRITFGDATLTVVELAFMFLWIWIAVGVVFDIFRSHDLSNWSKALWVLLVFVFPLIGVLGYLIVRGHTMHEHETHDRQQYEAFRQFTRRATSPGPANDVSKLADLRDCGVLTDEEFERAKARALG